MNDRDQLRVDCLGVFDTVGALGIPLEGFVRANRERYEFHDVDLNVLDKSLCIEGQHFAKRNDRDGPRQITHLGVLLHRHERQLGQLD